MTRALTAEEALELHGDAVRREARRELWRRGRLDYLLHEGQQRAVRAIGRTRHRRFVINVGRRWGKSRLMCVLSAWLVVLRMLHRKGVDVSDRAPPWLVRAATRTKRPARILYAAPTGGMIEEFIAPHMDLLIDHAPEEMCPRMLRGDYVFPDGDRIVMKGCEDRAKANRLRGPEADLAIVDEGGFVPILGYVVKSAIGFQLAETRGRLLMPSTPPESPDHPFVDFVAEAEARGAYFHATTADAPHITSEMLEEAIEDAGGEESVTWLREGMAQLVRDPEIVVLPEFTDALVGEHERPEHFLPCIIGDLGFTDQSVLAFGYYDFAEDLYVIEAEVAGQRLTSDVIDAQIAETTRRLWGDTPVHRRRLDGTARERADLSRPEWQQLEREGHDPTWLPVSRDGGPGKGRMQALANRARVICKRGRLIVDPSCETIIAHAKHARWDRSHKSFLRVTDENGQPLHHYDGAAALLYFLRDCDATTNPIPALPEGATMATHYIPPHLRPDAKRHRLAALLRSKR